MIFPCTQLYGTTIVQILPVGDDCDRRFYTTTISKYITNHCIFTGDMDVTAAIKYRRCYYGGKDAVIGYIFAKKQLR